MNTATKTDSVLALDIGGTKIFWALCAPETLLFQDQCNTPKGIAPLKQALASVVNLAQQEALHINSTLQPHLYISTPGNLIGPRHSIISPGSAQNLEHVKGEFDHLDLEALALSVLPKGWIVTIKNDAIAQMIGGLRELIQQEKIKPGKLGYIGPGTGLGGGFCNLDSAGNLDFYTDGHIYDIPLTLAQGTIARAEDVISGRAFFTQTGKDPKQVGADLALLNLYTPVIQTMGQYLGQLIETLYTGQIEKTPPSRPWTVNEKNLVQGTSVFLMGGSLGTQDPFASILLTQTQQTLKEKKLDFITLHRIQSPHKAALLGVIEPSKIST